MRYVFSHLEHVVAYHSVINQVQLLMLFLLCMYKP